MIEFTMPWPPSINGYWRTFRNRQIISKRGREYRSNAIAHLIDINLYNKKLSKSLSVELVLNPPTLRRYDIDNFNKALFDALSHGKFWVDDEQVIELRIIKGIKVKGGNIQLKVKELSDRL